MFLNKNVQEKLAVIQLLNILNSCVVWVTHYVKHFVDNQ